MIDVKKLNETIEDLDRQSQKLKSIQSMYKKLDALREEMKQHARTEDFMLKQIDQLQQALQATSSQYKENLHSIEDKHAALIDKLNADMQSIRQDTEEKHAALLTKSETLGAKLDADMQQTQQHIRHLSGEVTRLMQQYQADLDKANQSHLTSLHATRERVESSIEEYQSSLNQTNESHAALLTDLKQQLLKQIQEISSENSRLYLETKVMFEANLDLKIKELHGRLYEISQKMDAEQQALKKEILAETHALQQQTAVQAKKQGTAQLLIGAVAVVSVVNMILLLIQ